MPATVIPVKGVFRDGSVPVNQVPAPQVVHLGLGTDGDVRVTVVNSAGQPVDLTGATCTLGVKQYPDDPSPLFAVTGVVASPSTGGIVDFAISEANTTGIGAGTFCADVIVTFSDGKKALVVPSSPFVVDPAW